MAKGHAKLFDKTVETNNQPGAGIDYHDPSKSFAHLKSELEQQWAQFVTFVNTNTGKRPVIAAMTNCFYTSDYIKSFFCGTRPETLNKRPLNYYSQSDPLSDSFINSDEILTDLFSQFASSSHKIFHFQSGKDKHSFIIEKIGDDKTTSYRVYQSWERQFSLMQWLGIGIDLDPFQIEDDKTQSELYGKGKLLNANELKMFLLPMIKFVTEQLGRCPRVSIYDVNHAGCDLVVIDSTCIPSSQFNYKTIADLPFTSNAAYIRYNDHIYYINRTQQTLNTVSSEKEVCKEFDGFTAEAKKQPREQCLQKDGSYIGIPGVKCRTFSERELVMIQKITKHIHQQNVPSRDPLQISLYNQL